jgi:hypothetical protein
MTTHDRGTALLKGGPTRRTPWAEVKVRLT